ncbi:MAG: fasciclin domain-containing protein [Flavobacterium sp.]|nr:fasciclin domain-containing protein [Flavobacterium sp.]
MKKFSKIIGIALLSLTIFSCSDDDNNTPAQQTITDIAVANPDLSILVTALTRTNLAGTLDGSGQYTVFAPTNAAFTTFFTSLGANVTVNNVDVNVLKAILLNHVIGSEIKSTAIPAATYASTLSPINATTNAPTISMFVQKAGATVTLNGGVDSKGAVVTTADVDASNGVIHIVNRVIQIPTLVDHVVDNPEFDTLQAVVTSTSGTFGNQSAVLTALNGLTAAAPATLFAPNNAAFTAATTGTGFLTGTAVTAANVTKVLQYHVTTAGNVRSSQLTNNQVVPMFTSPVQNVTVILGTGTVDIRDTANNLSRVFQADIQASNGVIHGVNKVLKPVL